MQAGAEATGRPLSELVPEVFRSLLPGFFARHVPEERHATCGDCPMCRPGPATRGVASTTFSATAKCCTYYPELPNYLLGALLTSSEPGVEEGQRRVRQILRQRVGVSPFGLVASRRYRFLYEQSPQAFGRAASLVCPLFDGAAGGCTVWPFREAVAITYFCKHVRGEDGRLFWVALRDYLVHAYRVLAQFALHRLGWPGECLLEEPGSPGLMPHEVDERAPDAEAYRTLWRDWVDREEELFVDAHRTVIALDRSAFERLGGIRQTLLLDRLEGAYRAMLSPRIPDRLLRNPALEVFPSENGYLLVSYSRNDPLRVRREVLHLLDRFDGRLATAEVLGLLRETGSPVPSPELLLSLYQHRVLVAATPGDGAPHAPPVGSRGG